MIGLPTRAVTGVDGGDVDNGGFEGESVGGVGVEDAEEGEIEAVELEGEEFGGNGGAEEGRVRPRGGEAVGVVGVEVGEEVSFASFCPTVYGD